MLRLKLTFLPSRTPRTHPPMTNYFWTVRWTSPGYRIYSLMFKARGSDESNGLLICFEIKGTDPDRVGRLGGSRCERHRRSITPCTRRLDYVKNKRGGGPRGDLYATGGVCLQQRGPQQQLQPLAGERTKGTHEVRDATTNFVPQKEQRVRSRSLFSPRHFKCAQIVFLNVATFVLAC